MSNVNPKHAKPADPVPAAPDYDHMLYVIFHGAIAFYDDPAVPWIDAFPADLSNDHVYVCGKFLGELCIPKNSSMLLSGVTAGQDSFANYATQFIHYTGQRELGGARIHLDHVYSRFTFPRPDAILHALNFKRSDGKDSRMMCIVPVFQYRFDSVDELFLRLFVDYGASRAPGTPSPGSTSDSFDWMPDKSDPTPLTLHIRAEEDRDESQMDRDHTIALQILEDSTNLDVTPFDQEVLNPLPGFDGGRSFWEIQLSLSQRVNWLTDVGAAIQRHPPSPGTSFTIVAPALTKDDDPSCGGESGGPGGG